MTPPLTTLHVLLALLAMLGLASGTPCDGTFTNDEPTNHFTADCTGVTTFKALCALTITAVGYSGGRVSCTADGTYQTIQATDTNGCALDTDGCGGDTNALCSNDAPNARTCTCTNGFYPTTTLSDTQSFPGCVQDGICTQTLQQSSMCSEAGSLEMPGTCVMKVRSAPHPVPADFAW